MPTAPPHNLEAEEHVLGSVLLQSRCIEDVLETGLAYTDFYRDKHGLIFKSMCLMYDRGEPLDLLTLANYLEETKQLEAIGGTPRLAELAAIVPATSTVGRYARIVKDTALVRRLVNAGLQIAEIGKRPGDSLALLSEAESLLAAVADSSIIGGSFTPLGQDVEDVTREILEAMESGKSMMGLLSGFPDLDKITTGFHPAQLVMIAARPSMGKSALAQNIVENIADQELHSAILSLEMSRKDLLLRSLSRASKIPFDKLRTGTIHPLDVPKLHEGKAIVNRQKEYIQVHDNPGITLSQLRAEAKRMARGKNLGMVVVDYLQLMLSASNSDNRQNEVAAISRGLKILAHELQVPVLALSQLNRNLESRTDKRPQLSDLRDSGALEQDADIVLFIYRDEFYNPESPDQGVAEVIVAKNRNGQQGVRAKLSFRGQYVSFGSLAREQADE